VNAERPARPQDPAEQLEAFIRRFAPEHRALIRAARTALRRRLRAAHELVYDNYNFFVIGYSSTVRPSDCVVAIAAAASGVGLALYRGATLPDPHQILLGSGRQNRFVRLDSAAAIRRPEVQALIDAAVSQARAPLPRRGKGRLIIRSVSAKQRPRKRESSTSGVHSRATRKRA